ncbi:1,2-phenylacetyl-CoA epoxidase subunit PaaC [Orrella sp. JC864]|uniref:1,2-phenylacetyl-CoA epoxidase subunit PaaC n=1 Tax=Orrella sp. JC864 TaxID=3120298 RepID=UPI0012BB67F9
MPSAPAEPAACTALQTEFLLRLADTPLVLSQRLAQWCGHGPELEEDLALTNTALDLLGQARLWLTLAGQVQGQGKDEDALAYLRDAHEYRNVLLAELPNGDYAHTMVRQFFLDVWQFFLLQALARSADARVAAIAEKSVKETAYHVRRSSDLVVRLGDGTEESHARMQAAVDALWPYTGELFIDDELDLGMAGQGIACTLQSLYEPWSRHVGQVCRQATLALPDPAQARHAAMRGGRQGRHTEALGYLLAEMQYLQRAYPGGAW